MLVGCLCACFGCLWLTGFNVVVCGLVVVCCCAWLLLRGLCDVLALICLAFVVCFDGFGL